MRDPDDASRIPLAPLVRGFLATEAAGGVLLVVAAVAAVMWANSPFGGGYASFAGRAHHVVSDGLLSLFFLVAGLEIRRELTSGELRDRRVAALPAFAALGGMLVPAAVYVACNVGAVGVDGWGIPVATDIAFAVGVLALLGSRVPTTLKLFLLSLAIVDDIGAIVVIAVVYSADLDLVALGLAACAVAGAALLRSLRFEWLPAYAVLGFACWLATNESGIHPTIAGVAFALVVPSRHAAGVERTLHPITSFVIVPLFALANAGVELRADAFDAAGASRVAIGVALGLVVGKLAGVLGASWLAVRAGAAALPEHASWASMAGVAALAGIGFTVSIFITGLAFDDAPLVHAAKLAILGASVVSAALGAAILSRARVSSP